MDLLMWLQQWYDSQCNGDWEHSYGVEIETVDNPGWRVSINLTDTTASGATMPPLNQDHGDDDWIFCKVENGRFEGAGDPSKLTVILEQFRELVGRYDPHSTPQKGGWALTRSASGSIAMAADRRVVGWDPSFAGRPASTIPE